MDCTGSSKNRIERLSASTNVRWLEHGRSGDLPQLTRNQPGSRLCLHERPLAPPRIATHVRAHRAFGVNHTRERRAMPTHMVPRGEMSDADGMSPIRIDSTAFTSPPGGFLLRSSRTPCDGSRGDYVLAVRDRRFHAVIVSSRSRAPFTPAGRTCRSRRRGQAAQRRRRTECRRVAPG